ncbi:MAG TPA: cytochrome c3 family protein [Candidatus Deferrimicrobium sp.]|nr:cytochrome c3 family protein [Candidatus Deferrimicrobium sp.]
MNLRRPDLRAGLAMAIVTGATAMMAGTPLEVPVSDLIFSHPLHVTDQGIECIVCHAAIPSSTIADDRNLPSMDVCADCHDIEDDENCGQCHRDPDNPSPAVEIERSVLFNHKLHLDLKTGCLTCHSLSAENGEISRMRIMPGKPLCMNCHDGLRAAWNCHLCHADKTALADIHPIGWRHQHADQATVKPEWCRTCHQREVYCISCHRGDNQAGNIHDLNYEYTHGLDAQGKEADCVRCHDRRAFCNDCHERENRMPLAHSTLAWRNEHGRAARTDIENCASCHEVGDPTCARAGCHRDSDGIRGTDPRLHSADLNRFDSHGPWHSDDGYFCFACHTGTGRSGVGFCGYCHGDAD